MTDTESKLLKKFDTLDLKNYSSNKFSQWGEDGVISKIFQLINVDLKNGWCVEFGAWDGMYLSNTCNLIKNYNFSSVLIEPNKKKYNELCKNFPSERVIKVCSFVDFEGKNSLDNILNRTNIPKDFDLLSIDIDGCDYHIFESFYNFRPKLICIEYNFTIPNEVEFIQKKDLNVNKGSSALSLLKLANNKDYFLAHISHSNMIFIDNKFKDLFKNTQLSLDKHRDDSKYKNFVFFGYDGEVISNKKDFHLRWHRYYFNIKEIQVLPKMLRKLKANYNFFDKCNYAIFLLFKSPSTFAKKTISKFTSNR